MLLALCAGASAGERLTVRADEWYPVNGAPGAEAQGFAIELLQKMFHPLEIEVDYQLLDWQRALELANSGGADCVVGAYKSEAPLLLFPAHALAEDQNAFFVLADSDWRYQGIDSIGRRTIAVIGEYDYGGDIDGWIASRPVNVHIAHGQDPLRRNLRMLLAGRVDALVESVLVMEATLAELGLAGQLREAGQIGALRPFYFACGSGARGAHWIALFDQRWQVLQSSGELEAIYRRYQLSPPPH